MGGGATKLRHFIVSRLEPDGFRQLSYDGGGGCLLHYYTTKPKTILLASERFACVDISISSTVQFISPLTCSCSDSVYVGWTCV